jgi:NAD(P)H dehydrogenase (quinone)
VARALAAIARDPKLAGCIVELTGPESISMPELAQAISAAAGTEIPFATITEDEYRELCRQDHLPEEVTEMLTSLYRAAEAMEFSHVASDIEKLTGTPPERAADAIARLVGRA